MPQTKTICQKLAEHNQQLVTFLHPIMFVETFHGDQVKSYDHRRHVLLQALCGVIIGKLEKASSPWKTCKGFG